MANSNERYDYLNIGFGFGSSGSAMRLADKGQTVQNQKARLDI